MHKCLSFINPFTFILSFKPTNYIPTSIVQYISEMQKSKEWGCRDGMHYAKNHGNKKIPLAIYTMKDTSKIMRNPSLHSSGKGLHMIVLVSLIV